MDKEKTLEKVADEYMDDVNKRIANHQCTDQGFPHQWTWSHHITDYFCFRCGRTMYSVQRAVRGNP